MVHFLSKAISNIISPPYSILRLCNQQYRWNATPPAFPYCIVHVKCLELPRTQHNGTSNVLNGISHGPWTKREEKFALAYCTSGVSNTKESSSCKSRWGFGRVLRNGNINAGGKKRLLSNRYKYSCRVKGEERPIWGVAEMVHEPVNKRNKVRSIWAKPYGVRDVLHHHKKEIAKLKV